MSGIDVARALALVGMVSVHLREKGSVDLAARLYALPHGRASILFVLIAGIGIALHSARLSGRADARLRLFWFSLVMLPLGLVLQALEHPVAVILHHYAAFYLFGLCVLGLARRWLFLLAIALTILGPLIYFLGSLHAPRAFSGDTVSITDPIGQILMALLISGPYPLLTWSAPLVWGIWLGRQDLRAPRLRPALCVLGAALALFAAIGSEVLTQRFGYPASAADWRFIFVAAPHSEMPLWMIGSIGSAFFVLGLTLIVSERVPNLVRPLAALGQLALTMYVLHLFALHWWADWLRSSSVLYSAGIVLLFAVFASVFAVAWRARWPRGPIESLIHLPWDIWSRMARAPEHEHCQEPWDEAPHGRAHEAANRA